MDPRYYANIKQMNRTMNKGLAHGNVPYSICFPEEVTITATMRCNYRCRMCFQTHFDQEIDWKVSEKLQAILPFADRFQVFGGEPLMYSRINDVYAMARSFGAMIMMISNGSLLTESMCESIVRNRVGHIKFSIDAGSAKTYKLNRGGNFSRVIMGVATLNEYKKYFGVTEPNMHFNFLLMRSNMSELPKLVTIAKEVGVAQINVFYPSCLTEEMVDECVYFCQEESDAWLTRAKGVAEELGVGLQLPPLFRDCPTEPGKTNRFCADPWTKLIVGIDGEVSLCCAAPTIIGNLLTQDFDEIWNGPFAQNLRAKVNTPEEPEYCRNCRVRKPIPSELDLHIRNKGLQAAALKKYGVPEMAAAC